MADEVAELLISVKMGDGSERTFSEVRKGFEETAEGAEDASDSVDDSAESLRKLVRLQMREHLAALATAFKAVAGAGLEAFRKLDQAASEGARTSRVAEDWANSLHMTANEVQALSDTFARFGAGDDLADVGDLITEIAVKAQDAARGNEDLQKIFDRYGVSVPKALQNSSDAFFEIVDALATSTKATQAMVDADELLSDQGKKLVGQLRGQKTTLTEVQTEMLRYQNLTDEQREGLARLDKANQELQKQEERLASLIEAETAPAIAKVKEEVAKLTSSLIDNHPELATFVGVAQTIAQPAGEAALGILQIGANLALMSDKLGPAKEKLAELGGVIGLTKSAGLWAGVLGLGLALNKLSDYLQDAGGKAWESERGFNKAAGGVKFLMGRIMEFMQNPFVTAFSTYFDFVTWATGYDRSVDAAKKAAEAGASGAAETARSAAGGIGGAVASGMTAAQRAAADAMRKQEAAYARKYGGGRTIPKVTAPQDQAGPAPIDAGELQRQQVEQKEKEIQLLETRIETAKDRLRVARNDANEMRASVIEADIKRMTEERERLRDQLWVLGDETKRAEVDRQRASELATASDERKRIADSAKADGGKSIGGDLAKKQADALEAQHKQVIDSARTASELAKVSLNIAELTGSLEAQEQAATAYARSLDNLATAAAAAGDNLAAIQALEEKARLNKSQADKLTIGQEILAAGGVGSVQEVLRRTGRGTINDMSGILTPPNVSMPGISAAQLGKQVGEAAAPELAEAVTAAVGAIASKIRSGVF